MQRNLLPGFTTPGDVTSIRVELSDCLRAEAEPAAFLQESQGYRTFGLAAAPGLLPLA